LTLFVPPTAWTRLPMITTRCAGTSLPYATSTAVTPSKTNGSDGTAGGCWAAVVVRLPTGDTTAATTTSMHRAERITLSEAWDRRID